MSVDPRGRAPRPPLIQYWHARPVPSEVGELLGSLRRRNPEMRHLVFDREEAEAFLAERFSAREVAAFHACAVPAMQADYFRYCAVLALGGAYADADFRGLAPLQPLLAPAGGGRLFGRPGVPRGWAADILGTRPRVGPFRLIVNSFFSFAEPGHPLLALAKEVATANVEARIAEDVAVVTGPGIFTSLYLVARLGSLDAFREYAAEGVLASSAGLFSEVVESHERVAAAFEGVRVWPFERTRQALAQLGDELSYKSTAAHWVRHSGSIFKQ